MLFSSHLVKLSSASSTLYSVIYLLYKLSSLSLIYFSNISQLGTFFLPFGNLRLLLFNIWLLFLQVLRLIVNHFYLKNLAFFLFLLTNFNMLLQGLRFKFPSTVLRAFNQLNFLKLFQLFIRIVIHFYRFLNLFNLWLFKVIYFILENFLSWKFPFLSLNFLSYFFLIFHHVNFFRISIFTSILLLVLNDIFITTLQRSFVSYQRSIGFN